MMVFWTSFILGLSSSLHCLGMCGPIVMAVPVKGNGFSSRAFGILEYNLGRISTYALLGALIGFVGLGVQTFGIMQWVSIFSGAFILLFAWKNWISRKMESIFAGFGLRRFVSFGMGNILAGDFPFKLFLLGSLNGLLPCGMVYLALVNALLAGNSPASALAMLFFGLGTLPAMVAAGLAAKRINSEFRASIQKMVPFLLSITGVLVMLRGMNLDIPYLSPKVIVQTEKNVCEKKQEVNASMSCCHKK